MGSKQQVNDFINMIAPYVTYGCKVHGWGVPSAIIGHALKESMKSTGPSGLATTCFNYFGMKWVKNCGTDYKEYPTKERKPDGTYVTIQARFRKYANVAAGIEGYFQFIEAYKRYAPVIASKDYTSFAKNVSACGWATAESKSYIEGIIKYVKDFDLTRFDDPNTSVALGTVVTPTVPNYKEGSTYTTTTDLNIREQPFGTKMKYECITENGKQHAFFDDYGNAVLKKGTKVTCKAISKRTNSTWMLIPSGWICAIEAGKVYVN